MPRTLEKRASACETHPAAAVAPKRNVFRGNWSDSSSEVMYVARLFFPT